jgi:hypothetical protein
MVKLYCMPGASGCAPASPRCVATTEKMRPATHSCTAGTEGRVFVEPRERTVPLRMYHDGSGDYVTSTRSPGTTYSLDGVVGHVLPQVNPP